MMIRNRIKLEVGEYFSTTVEDGTRIQGIIFTKPHMYSAVALCKVKDELRIMVISEELHGQTIMDYTDRFRELLKSQKRRGE